MLEVVYAGTGPFAPLAIPLMPMPGVHFTLIDIHNAATSSVRHILDRLGLHASVVPADATAYEHPAPIHVAITETMQRALQKEPFVAVTRNLRRQLAPRGLLIPERVTVDVALLDPAVEQARWNGEDVAAPHERLGTVVEITSAREVIAPIDVTVPHDGHWPALVTRIDVFGDICLDDYESGLTMPEILWPLAPSRAGDVVKGRDCRRRPSFARLADQLRHRQPRGRGDVGGEQHHFVDNGRDAGEELRRHAGQAVDERLQMPDVAEVVREEVARLLAERLSDEHEVFDIESALIGLEPSELRR